MRDENSYELRLPEEVFNCGAGALARFIRTCAVLLRELEPS